MGRRRSEMKQARARCGGVALGSARGSVHSTQSLGTQYSVLTTRHSRSILHSRSTWYSHTTHHSAFRTQYSVLSTLCWLLVLGVASLSSVATLQAAPPAPITNLRAELVPNENGMAVRLKWTLSTDDATGSETPVRSYSVHIQENRRHSKLILMELLKGRSPFRNYWSARLDQTELAKGTTEYEITQYDPQATYHVWVVSIGADGSKSWSPALMDVHFRVDWFDRTKLSFLLVTLAVCGTVIVCTEIARRGKPFYVRPIAGLQAIEEAVGRATEMGRPMLFVPGIEDVKEIDTVAGLMILSHVAKTAAEYDTPLEVPTTRSLVMTAAREAVQAAALAAGRPDYYDEERIHYVTDEQFGYVAATCGWMYREKPAACFFLGKFFAESLILAETGNAIGAIQIAGTAETTQLPFFVAACDYTLLGEELFAASAYLSGEPAQLGMLKGQDFGKLAAIVLVVIGCGLATWDSLSPRGPDDFGKPLPSRVQLITDTVLKGGG